MVLRKIYAEAFERQLHFEEKPEIIKSYVWEEECTTKRNRCKTLI